MSNQNLETVILINEDNEDNKNLNNVEIKETINLEYLQDNIVKNTIIEYINKIDEYKNIINNNKDKQYENLNIQLFNIIQNSHLNYLRLIYSKSGIIQDYCNTIPNYYSLYFNKDILKTIHI